MPLGSGMAWLWLWCRMAAITPIRPLVWEPPYAAGAALEKDEKTKKKKKKRVGSLLLWLYHCMTMSPFLSLFSCWWIHGLFSTWGYDSKAVRNIFKSFFGWTLNSFSSWMCPSSVAGSENRHMFSFSRYCRFSKVVAPNDTPTSRAWESQLLHILQ